MSEWWSSVVGPVVEQGDLIVELPVVRAKVTFDDKDALPAISADVMVVDAIIVTQTCDLANAKAAEVLVARVYSWRSFAESQYAAGNTVVKSAAYIEGLLQGNIPPLSLLYHHAGTPRFPWSVVDFRELYTVDRDHLDQHLAKSAHRSRLRLVAPYKEHLGQSFARYFMRVGLPIDAADFRSAGKRETEHLGKTDA